MKKKTFLIINSDLKKQHLQIIISDPDPEKNIMVVNLTTLRNNGREDTACVLGIDEHKFIKQGSYIAYHYATEINQLKLLNDKLSGRVEFKDDISDPVLKKIQDGAKKSSFLQPYYKKFFRYF